MTVKKRIGYLLLGILPLPTGWLVQFLLIVPLTGLAAMGVLIEGIGQGASDMDLFARLFEITEGSAFADVLQIVHSALLILIFGCWLRALSKNDGKVPFKKGKQLLGFLLGLVLLMIGLQYLTEIIYEGVAMISPSAATDYEELTELAGLGDPSPMMYIYVVVLGPIGEELLFRGVALGYFRRIMPFGIANLLQAVMFGIYHMNLMQGIYTLAGGLLFGLIAEKGGRILDSILAHCIFNLLGITGVLYLWADNPYFLFAWMPLMVLTLILGGMLLFPGDKKPAEAFKVF